MQCRQMQIHKAELPENVVVLAVLQPLTNNPGLRALGFRARFFNLISPEQDVKENVKSQVYPQGRFRDKGGGYLKSPGRECEVTKSPQ